MTLYIINSNILSNQHHFQYYIEVHNTFKEMKIKKFQSLYLAHLFIPKIKTLVRLLQMEWHMFLPC